MKKSIILQHCNYCHQDKHPNTFINKNRNRCNQCIKEYKKQWHKLNHERLLKKSKVNYEQNKQKYLDYGKLYRNDNINKPKIQKYQKNYREQHKKEMANYQKQYQEINQEQIAKKKKERYNLHRKNIIKKHVKYALKTGIYKWRRSWEYEKWTQAVYKRDNYICQDCDKTNCKVNAHHIKMAKDFPDLRYDINNGICLCVECHKKRHHITHSL